ncbi:MAG: beta-ketoacyl-ACP reductase, partial [bacterium]
MDFAGKTAIVTGASRRIGASVAVALGRGGASVLV